MVKEERRKEKKEHMFAFCRFVWRRHFGSLLLFLSLRFLFLARTIRTKTIMIVTFFYLHFGPQVCYNCLNERLFLHFNILTKSIDEIIYRLYRCTKLKITTRAYWKEKKSCPHRKSVSVYKEDIHHLVNWFCKDFFMNDKMLA